MLSFPPAPQALKKGLQHRPPGVNNHLETGSWVPETGVPEPEKTGYYSWQGTQPLSDCDLGTS